MSMAVISPDLAKALVDPSIPMISEMAMTAKRISMSLSHILRVSSISSAEDALRAPTRSSEPCHLG